MGCVVNLQLKSGLGRCLLEQLLWEVCKMFFSMCVLMLLPFGMNVMILIVCVTPLGDRVLGGPLVPKMRTTSPKLSCIPKVCVLWRQKRFICGSIKLMNTAWMWADAHVPRFFLCVISCLLPGRSIIARWLCMILAGGKVKDVWSQGLDVSVH